MVRILINILEQLMLTSSCGLYYKHITIVNYDSSIVNKILASFTDDARVVLYICHMFMLQAIGSWGRIFNE